MIRNVWGIHTDINGMDIELLRRSALVKVLFETQDAPVVKSWTWATSPNTYWVYRSPIDLDSGTNPGELQVRYLAIDESNHDAGYALGQWYAEWNAAWVKPNGMEYFFIESGPNEQNDSTQRAIGYLLGFVERCVELGIKPAAGMHSFGTPMVTKFNGIDGWKPFEPVFRALDKANAGHNTPQACYQFHEYAIAGDMMASVDHAIGRYRLAPYDGPRMIGELGYADYNRPPTTERTLEQIQAVMAYYGQDPNLMGCAWYDIRQHTDHQYRYAYGDVARALDVADRSDPEKPKAFPTLPIVVNIGATPPPPPPVDPETKTFVKTISTTGQNIRKYPSLSADIVGSLEYNEAIEINTEEAASIGLDKAWIKVKTGWCAAWLLKKG